MCGIFGAINVDVAQQQVLSGLKNLEYRGYDSWGIACLDQKIFIQKNIGQIGQIKKLALPNSKVAIGHTRWATHGGVTKTNAHPHLSSDGSFALVQNGVVENYLELKNKLIKLNYKFKTQTDTEVIVKLIEFYLKKIGQKNLDKKILKQVFSKLSGRSTILILDDKGQVFGFKQGSPLLIGKRGLKIYCASDLLSLAQVADNYLALADGEIFTYTNNKLETKNKFKQIKLKNKINNLNNFSHYMLKEIHEQGEVLANFFAGQEEVLVKISKKIKQARRVYCIGSGSASFVTDYLANLLRQQNILAFSAPAYEAESFKTLADKQDVGIFFSQSGETADNLEVLTWMKTKGVEIVSVVNMPGSTQVQQANLNLMLQVGPEIGVASTKAYTSMLAVSLGLAELVTGKKIKNIKNKILATQNSLKNILENKLWDKELVKIQKFLENKTSLFVLGRGELYSQAKESALKLKEIAYLHSEAFSGGELKHGVLALVEKNTPVWILIKDDSELDSMLNAAHEVKARGAKVIAVAHKNYEIFDYYLPLPTGKSEAAILASIPAQILTYKLALAAGRNPDKPRNLAKSVTVK